MKKLGLIVFGVMNLFAITVLGASERKVFLKEAKEEIMQSSSEFFQIHSLFEMAVIFIGVGILFLLLIYVIFEIYLFLGFLSNQKKI